MQQKKLEFCLFFIVLQNSGTENWIMCLVHDRDIALRNENKNTNQKPKTALCQSLLLLCRRRCRRRSLDNCRWWEQMFINIPSIRTHTFLQVDGFCYYCCCCCMCTFSIHNTITFLVLWSQSNPNDAEMWAPDRNITILSEAIFAYSILTHSTCKCEKQNTIGTTRATSFSLLLRSAASLFVRSLSLSSSQVEVYCLNPPENTSCTMFIMPSSCFFSLLSFANPNW